MAVLTICSDFRVQEEEICHYFHLFQFYLPWGNGAGCHDLRFFILSFRSTLSLFSFTFIKRLFNVSLFIIKSYFHLMQTLVKKLMTLVNWHIFKYLFSNTFKPKTVIRIVQSFLYSSVKFTNFYCFPTFLLQFFHSLHMYIHICIIQFSVVVKYSWHKTYLS